MSKASAFAASALLALAAVGLAAPSRAESVQSYLTQAEAETLFRKANDACLKEDLQAGIEGYEALARAGWGSVDVLYNLGTAELRQGRLGMAVLYLERALRLDPSDGDVRANLEAARKLRVDKLVGAPEEVGNEEPFASRLASHTRGDAWALAFLALWMTTAAALLARHWAPARLRGPLLAAGLLAGAGAVTSAAVTAVHAFVEVGSRGAVVVSPSLKVREGPQESFKASFEVHEGLKVRLLDREGSFRRIQLANGLQGWIPADGAVEISP